MIHSAHRILATLRPSVLLVTVLALMLGTVGVVNAAAKPSTKEGTLVALVQSCVIGGPPPPPGVSSTPVCQPVPSLSVDARLASATGQGAMQEITNEQGQATFQLPHGTYWVYVPQGAQSTAGAMTSVLPDGTPVVTWAQVSVPRGGHTVATLTITFAQP